MRLEADPTRLEQVSANLLNNAAKYTEPGGHDLAHGAELEGGEAVLRVRDTGIGIPPECWPSVFELFVQASERGSLARSRAGLGIGLTLVRSLVEMHGGSVAAHSDGPRPGQRVRRAGCRCPGAGRHGRRPMPEPARPGPLAGACASWSSTTTWTPPRAWPCCSALWGHEVRVAHDGPAALEAAPSTGPDVVLLDIGLPGMDGYEVAQRLRDDPGLDGACWWP